MPDASGSSRRVLLITYWFPPAVGAAAERMSSFARYLLHHGWEVDVLTAERASGSVAPNICAVPDPLGTAADTPFADYDPRRQPSRWRTLARDLFFPDRFRQWQRRALPQALELARSRGASLILASFPPASAVQLALRVNEATGIPLALDFRDLWIGPGGYQPRLAWVRRAHEDLRRRAIAAASLVIVVSEAMADALAAEQICPRDRIVVIPNGYEPDDLSAGEAPIPVEQRSSLLPARPSTVVQSSSLPAPRPAPLTIAHVGTVIPRNRPDLFFDSLAALHRGGRLADVRFRFVGNLSADYIRSLGLQDVVQTTGLVPRQEARRAMAEADALLLLVGAYVGRWGHNAKLFEYLQTGRPILCLEEQPDSNDRRLLEQFAGDRSHFAAIYDPQGMADAIVRLEAFISKNSSSQFDSLPGFEKYSRSNLVRDLAAALSRMTSR